MTYSYLVKYKPQTAVRHSYECVCFFVFFGHFSPQFLLHKAMTYDLANESVAKKYNESDENEQVNEGSTDRRLF